VDDQRIPPDDEMATTPPAGDEVTADGKAAAGAEAAVGGEPLTGAWSAAPTNVDDLEERVQAARRQSIMRRRRRREKRRRRRRILLIVLIVVAVPTTVVAVDYARYMRQPSSLAWKIRTVEYFRDRHLAWLVNTAESWYYGWTAPEKGGPGLTALPDVGGADHTTSPSPKPSATKTKKPPYRPPDVKGAITPALKNEGVWKAVSTGINGAPPILATTFRAEADYPRLVTYAVWVDSTRTRLALYPGRYQPPRIDERGPMMIPYGQRKWALGSFNSGFTKGDWGGGWAINGRVLDPLVPGKGTIVAYRNGKVDVIAWRDGIPLTTVVLARQNLPLIVLHGKPNPALNETQLWGFTFKNAVRVWRSGVGVDRKGNLIYVAADKQTAPSLAEALVRAGAVRAIELDINSAWPTFNVYWRPGCQKPAMILPNDPNHTTRYLYPDDRDFFVVYRKKPGEKGNPGVPYE